MKHHTSYNTFDGVNNNWLTSHAKTVAETDRAEIRRGLFSDDREIEFGVCLSEFIPETEVESEARAEWEPKAEESPEVFVFKTTCKDIASRLFETPQTVLIRGSKAANAEHTGAHGLS